MEDAKSLIQKVERYEENPKKTPFQLVYQLARLILPKDTAWDVVGLVAIGGEAILIRIQNKLGKQFTLKIAREAMQPKEDEKEEKEGILSSFTKHFQKHPRISIPSERFFLGLQLQNEIYTDIRAKKLSGFYVPEIYTINPNPRYAIMEYIDSPTIMTWLVEKQDVEISLKAFFSLCSLVKFIHDRGVVHRDIKTENILIYGINGEVCLLDWTLSKRVGDRNLTVIGARGGTPGYASPKCMGDGEFKKANYLDDIFSLGITFWEFIRFTSITPPGLELYTSQRKVEEWLNMLRRNLPENMEKIFGKCTSYSEKERYTCIDEILRDMLILMGEYGIDISSDSPSSSVERTSYDVIFSDDVLEGAILEALYSQNDLEFSRLVKELIADSIFRLKQKKIIN